MDNAPVPRDDPPAQSPAWTPAGNAPRCLMVGTLVRLWRAVLIAFALGGLLFGPWQWSSSYLNTGDGYFYAVDRYFGLPLHRSRRASLLVKLYRDHPELRRRETRLQGWGSVNGLLLHASTYGPDTDGIHRLLNELALATEAHGPHRPLPADVAGTLLRDGLDPLLPPADPDAP